MKIEEVELIETEYKTKKKFIKTGTLRLQNTLVKADAKSAFDLLVIICERVDCNFNEVLDAVNRSVR